MKRTTDKTGKGDGLLPFYSPSILISPLVRATLRHDQIIESIIRHKDMGRMPCTFHTRDGEAFFTLTTADRTTTIILFPQEMERFTTGLRLRELNEATVNE